MLFGVYVGLQSRSEEHTSELQSHSDLVCRLLLEKKTENGGARTRAATAGASSTEYDRGAGAGPDATVPQSLPRCRGPGQWGDHSCFFFNDTATTEIYTLSLHDALPI